MELYNHLSPEFANDHTDIINLEGEISSLVLADVLSSSVLSHLSMLTYSQQIWQHRRQGNKASLIIGHTSTELLQNLLGSPRTPQIHVINHRKNCNIRLHGSLEKLPMPFYNCTNDIWEENSSFPCANKKGRYNGKGLRCARGICLWW